MADYGRVLPIYKGAYSPSTTYEKLDSVLFDNSSWTAKQTTLNHEPPSNGDPENAYWQLAAKGFASVGDMYKSTYDPNSKNTDAFNSSNHTYDNSISGLTSTTTKTAIDELVLSKVSKDDIIINVKDYGAKGDGVTNDTTSIQNVLNSSNYGDIIFVPSGSYLVNSTLILKEGVQLIGTGFNSVIVAMDGSNLTDIVKLNGRTDRPNYGFSISELCFDGNKANNPTGGNGLNINCTYKGFLRHVQVINCHKKGVYWNGNSTIGSNTNLLDDCWIYGNDEEGIYLSEYCGDMHINLGDIGSNTLENIMFKCPGSSIEGVTCWGSKTASGIKVTSVGCAVHNSRIEGNAHHGIEISAGYTSLIGNKIYDNAEFGNAGNYSGIYISNPDVVLENIDIISNKVFSGLYSGNGIHKYALDFADYYKHANATILSNSFNYIGNGVVSNTREIVNGLVQSDKCDYSWVNTNFYAYNSVAQSIGAGAWVKLNFNTESYDYSNEFNLTTGEFEVLNTGTYHFDITVMINHTSAGQQDIRLALFINGGNASYDLYANSINNVAVYVANGSITVNLAKGWSVVPYIFLSSNDSTIAGYNTSKFIGKIAR